MDKRGFTLIEVLISIAIMATIAAIGYKTIDSMIKIEHNLKDTDKILNQLQKAFSQWQIDCANIEQHEIPNLIHNFKVMNYASEKPQSLWLIRRNSDTETKQSLWQLIIYNKSQSDIVDNNKYEWQRIAVEPTDNSNTLLKQISDIDNMLKSDEIQKINLLPIQNFNVKIWQELKWQKYSQLNNQLPIRGIQLNIELADEWRNNLGKKQIFNCITKIN